MQTERPLLTIAIPTFNRSKHLSLLLSVLSPQVKGMEKIEVIVSDNASTDDTQQMIRQFSDEGLVLRYIRNAENIGSDRNFLQCYEAAAGKYVWIVGDDDVIEPSGAGRVFSYLASAEEYDLLFLRSRGFSGSYMPLHQDPADDSITFHRAEDLACYVHVFFTFISGIVVNKDRVSQYQHRPFEELVGTGLMQLGWTYTALEHHRRSLAIRTPLVAALTNNTGGYSLFRVFGLNLKKITEEWISSEPVRRAILRGTLQSFFPAFLLQGKENSSFIQEDPHRLLRSEFGDYLHYWVFDFPIIRLPRWLGALWFLLVRAVNRADRALGSPLLRFEGF